MSRSEDAILASETPNADAQSVACGLARGRLRRDFTTHPRPRYPFPCRRLLRWRRTLRGCVAPQGLSLWPVFVVS